MVVWIIEEILGSHPAHLEARLLIDKDLLYGSLRRATDRNTPPYRYATAVFVIVPLGLKKVECLLFHKSQHSG